MALPIALFSSCSNVHQNSLIKQILKVDNLPDGLIVTDGISSFSWSIDTRYYTANIDLCSTDIRTIGNAEFAENVQAFIVHFDTKDEESFSQVKRWLPFLEQIEPEIQLLICDVCSQGDAVSREEAWKWCLENSFELIELQPETSENSDEEDDFQETVGIDRIIQALHAHSWPNLAMKDKPSYRSSLMTQMMRDEAKEKHEFQQEETGDSSLTTRPETHNNPPSSTSTQQTGDQSNVSLTPTDTEPLTADMQSLAVGSATQTTHFQEIWGKGKTTTEQGFENNFVDIDCGSKVSSGDFELLKITEKVKDGSGAGSKASSQVSESCDNTESVEVKQTERNPGSSGHTHTRTEAGIESLMGDEDIQMLAALGDSDHIGADGFEKLFDKLRVMKEQAESLPLEQRKKYAEKVAVEFWKAIGGEEGEIDGLSSEEEEDTCTG